MIVDTDVHIPSCVQLPLPSKKRIGKERLWFTVDSRVIILHWITYYLLLIIESDSRW